VSLLARAGVLAACLVTAAAVLHPAVRATEWLPGRAPILAALALLTAIALLGRAATTPHRWGHTLVAAGAVLLVGAVGGDGVVGHRGRLDLVAGQTRTNFEELGPGERSLGLRPLGFPLALEGLRPDGSAALAVPGRTDPLVLTPEVAAGFRGLRFGNPRTIPTGGASSLRISVSGGGADQIAEVFPGRSTQVGDLILSLDEYFPDFALDAQRQPYTRSSEPRNPGALLVVRTPERSFRVFVLQAMPGVHRVEEIDRSFALLSVEPAVSVEMDVHREPMALGALVGGLLILAGVVVGGRDS
jgi:hypothetical protein